MNFELETRSHAERENAKITKNITNRTMRNLEEHLDENGDLIPPWAKYPDYTRYSHNWDMGPGEFWRRLWLAFLKRFDDLPSRVSYLLRHPPAPYSWGNAVYAAMHPENGIDNELSQQRQEELLKYGLIRSDVAFETWFAAQESDPEAAINWPWKMAAKPIATARYWTRRLWFWSRQMTVLKERGTLEIPEAPDAWNPCAAILRSGVIPNRQGGWTRPAQII